MTSVGTEDMSSVAEGRVMLENQITVQEPKNHGEENREAFGVLGALEVLGVTGVLQILVVLQVLGVLGVFGV